MTVPPGVPAGNGVPTGTVPAAAFPPVPGTPPAGGLLPSSSLTLDKLIVAPGDVLNGTVTYQNTGASPITVQTIGIALRPPGGSNAGGPYISPTPSLPAQTIQPGATVTLTASRTFTTTDPLGAWYSYTTWQDAAGAWHDSPSLNFTVGDPPPPPPPPPPNGGLVISSPLTLDHTTVTAGDTLNGTVSYQNTSAAPIAVQTIGIAARPPGGTNAGGPYTNLSPSLPAQTIQPGATMTLAASRTFTSADPVGSWYSYTTWQDAAGGWHDSTNLTFTVTALPPPPAPPPPPPPTGELVIASPLVLDKLSVMAGDTLNGTVTYQNTSATPITVQTIGIAARPPGGTNAGGPYTNLAPSLAAQTIQPGATVTLAASRVFTNADPLGSWYSYTTYQDAAGGWHDSANVSFTVAAPAPVLAVAVNPIVASATPGGTINFQATVTGTAPGDSTSVTWSVAPGGGTIDQTGAYVAPAVPGTYIIIATSVADTTKIGTATANVGTSSSIIAADRRTAWNPGIPGGIPSRTTICATVNAATFGNGSTDATSAIQTAINGCPEGQVVYLPAGTYKVTSNLTIAKGIVLRGDGPTLTKIRASFAAGSVAVVYMANLWPTWGSAVNVTTDVPKDATSIPVANGGAFRAGDIVQIDQLDDTSYLYDGNCQWFKRPDYGPPTSGHRSQGQVVEVASITGNTLNITTPIHLGFKLGFAPQVFKPTGPQPPPGSTEPPGIVKYAGLESLYVTGGQNNQIHMQNCAYCWLANVESDGTTPAGSTASNGTAGPGNGMKGAHLLLDMSFRVVVRESYFHHATNVVQGGGAYGLSFSAHTSDSLVENNII